MLRSVLVLAGGTAIGQGVVILVSPILSRLYSPEKLGVLGVYIALLTILSMVVSLRYEVAIPLPKDTRDAAALATVAIVLIPVSSLLIGVFAWIFSEQIGVWTNTPGLSPNLWLLPIGIASVGVYQVANYWAIRKRAFGNIARTKLTQGIAGAVTQLVLFPLGALGLLAGHVVGSAAGTSTLALLAVRQDGSAFREVTVSRARSVALRYVRFPLIASFSGVINAGGVSLPVLILASLYDPWVAGQFALVQRVVSLPMTLLGGAVSQVYLGEGVIALRNSPTYLRTMFLRASVRLAILGIVPMLILVICGPALFAIGFGSDWSTAGEFARYLGPMMAAQLVASPLSQTLFVIERQAWQLAWDILRLLMVIGSFALTLQFGLSPTGAIALYGAAMFLSYLAHWGMQYAGITAAVRATQIT